MGDPQSIVHWFPEKDAQKCGYCSSSSGSVQYGMWAQSLTVNDYQNLIDRGWRRSGQYCYKPVMNETCCPLYTIKCNALNFHPSKSQKKVMKKMNKFLHVGILKNIDDQKGPKETDIQDQGIIDNYKECPNESVDLDHFPQIETEIGHSRDMNKDVSDVHAKKESEPVLSIEAACIDRCESASPSKSKSFKKGIGADPNKPPCKKAKLMRLENRLKKNGKSSQDMGMSSIHQQQGKSLEDFMNEISADDKLKLKTKLIEPTSPLSEWNKYEQLEFDLFRRYQNIIHNDPPHKNTLQGFLRFLVNTPLKRPNSSTISTENPAYGSYHQQYWLDSKLIAVGVIDILPKCISAVYFFYDPDYTELTLGTFGALKEIQLARELYPALNTEFYYMGFYVHTCKKMKYKGNMHPSFLLCPETYEWFPIEKCLEKLETSKYSRFNEDPDAEDVNECSPQHLDNMKIIIGNRFMTYNKFKNYFKKQDIFSNVGKLIGRKCIENMFFIES